MSNINVIVDKNNKNSKPPCSGHHNRRVPARETPRATKIKIQIAEIWGLSKQLPNGGDSSRAIEHALGPDLNPAHWSQDLARRLLHFARADQDFGAVKAMLADEVAKKGDTSISVKTVNSAFQRAGHSTSKSRKTKAATDTATATATAASTTTTAGTGTGRRHTRQSSPQVASAATTAPSLPRPSAPASTSTSASNPAPVPALSALPPSSLPPRLSTPAHGPLQKAATTTTALPSSMPMPMPPDPRLQLQLGQQTQLNPSTHSTAKQAHYPHSHPSHPSCPQPPQKSDGLDTLCDKEVDMNGLLSKMPGRKKAAQNAAAELSVLAGRFPDLFGTVGTTSHNALRNLIMSLESHVAEDEETHHEMEKDTWQLRDQLGSLNKRKIDIALEVGNLQAKVELEEKQVLECEAAQKNIAVLSKT